MPNAIFFVIGIGTALTIFAHCAMTSDARRAISNQDDHVWNTSVEELAEELLKEDA